MMNTYEANVNRQPSGNSAGGQYAPKYQPTNDAVGLGGGEVLDSLNPTSTVITDHNPAARATAPLAQYMTTLDQTLGLDPHEMVRIYRGVPREAGSDVEAGDFITTNRQLAADYAGNGKVISATVPSGYILDDRTEPLGEEYLYQPDAPIQQQTQPKLATDPSSIVSRIRTNAAAKATTRIDQPLRQQQPRTQGR